MVSCVNFNVQFEILMRLHILVLALTSFNVFPDNLELCKSVGDNAVNIMNYRQAKNDLYGAMKKFPVVDREIVLDSFSKDHVDLIGQLEVQIDSYGDRNYSDESRKYDEMEAKQENIVNSFKVKYISICLKK